MGLSTWLYVVLSFLEYVDFFVLNVKADVTVIF